MNENDQVEELQGENSAIDVPQEEVPGGFVEVSVEADAEVLRAEDFELEPEPEGGFVEVSVEADAEVIKAKPEPDTWTDRGGNVHPKKPEPEPNVPVVPEVISEQFPAPVKVEALVFRSRMKNSQSVRLVQAELIAQGYDEADADVQGWLCEGTQAALARFQTEHGLVGGGAADEATITALFDGSATHYWDR